MYLYCFIPFGGQQDGCCSHRVSSNFRRIKLCKLPFGRVVCVFISQMTAWLLILVMYVVDKADYIVKFAKVRAYTVERCVQWVVCRISSRTCPILTLHCLNAHTYIALC